jgi:hypothetical protein
VCTRLNASLMLGFGGFERHDEDEEEEELDDVERADDVVLWV